MIEKFKKFVKDKIYNQLEFYDNISLINKNGKFIGKRFFLTPYDEDYDYVKRQLCYFISSWDYPIYIRTDSNSRAILIDILKEKKS